MKIIARKLFARLSSASRIKLRSNLDHLLQRMEGQVSLGTGCSGTDVVVIAMCMVADLFETELGLRMKVDHAFSAEIVAFKQRFLKAHFEPTAFFGDIWDLARGEGKDVRSEKVIRALQVLFAFFGIECDSVSGLNQDASKNRACVASESGKPAAPRQRHFTTSSDVAQESSASRMSRPSALPTPAVAKRIFRSSSRS